VGVDGAVTGKSAEVLVVDDPFKNYLEAHSLSIRDGINSPFGLQTVTFPGFTNVVAVNFLHTRYGSCSPPNSIFPAGPVTTGPALTPWIFQSQALC
jgi:hypothetical protein